ncbi:SANT/Myb_domain [Hexamita inflata]|uniref:SANT/Myb domain n=1 Tax=Hexamita inflata TaxID=28002 RepID=A0AA86NJT4_9EUKA|nr:SANT/Myb domain [Hexamita inflata]
MNRTITKWSKEEQEEFDRLLELTNKNFKLMAAHFPHRTYNQVRSHYYNQVYKSAEPESTNEKTPTEVVPQLGNQSVGVTNILPVNSFIYSQFFTLFE